MYSPQAMIDPSIIQYAVIAWNRVRKDKAWRLQVDIMGRPGFYRSYYCWQKIVANTTFGP